MSKLPLKSRLDNVFVQTITRHKYDIFNENQKAIMMKWFEKTPYPKNEDYEIISQEIMKPMKTIKNWFKYHRRLRAMESEENIPQYKRKNVLHPRVFSKLKEYFTQNQNPSIKEFRELSKALNLKETQINSWFIYRRRKLRMNQTMNKKIPMQITIPKEEVIREEIAPIKQEYEPAAIRTIVKQEIPSQTSPQISTFPTDFPMQNMIFSQPLVFMMPMNVQRNLMLPVNPGYYQQFMNMNNMYMNRSLHGGIQQPLQMMPRQQFRFGLSPNCGFYGERF